MNTHHVEATVAADGSVLVPNVPFPPGQLVQVAIVSAAKPSADESELWKTLIGQPFVYVDPYEPAVPPEDWDVYQSPSSGKSAASTPPPP